MTDQFWRIIGENETRRILEDSEQRLQQRTKGRVGRHPLITLIMDHEDGKLEPEDAA